MTQPYVTPKVRALAERLSVDLAKVQATGVGGRIRTDDVRAAAGLPRQVAPAQPRAEAPARRTPVTVQSHWNPNRTLTLDVFGPNPLVDDARQVSGSYALAVREGPAPTLFADGDLPTFTASGVPVAELRKVPWYARHAVAAAPAAWTVLRAIEHFAHDVDDPAGEYEHNGAADYAQRVKHWLEGRGVERNPYSTEDQAAFDRWMSETDL